MAHDRLRGLLVQRPLAALVLAVAHHPQADARDAQPGCAEVDVSHRSSPWVADGYFALTVVASRDTSVTPGTTWLSRSSISSDSCSISLSWRPWARSIRAATSSEFGPSVIV